MKSVQKEVLDEYQNCEQRVVSLLLADRKHPRIAVLLRQPEPHGAVLSGRGQGQPVGGKRQAVDSRDVAGQGPELLAAGRVPQPDGRVVTAGQDPTTVR